MALAQVQVTVISLLQFHAGIGGGDGADLFCSDVLYGYQAVWSSYLVPSGIVLGGWLVGGEVTIKWNEA